MVSLPRSTSLGAATILPAADGFPLGATIYEPRRARATAVIHGATAVPHGYYGAFAGYLAERARVRVIAYDYRGVGASRPRSLRGFGATMTDWARLDARAVHAWARDRGDPIVMVGHSFGGQLIGLVDELREAKAAVLVASQLGWYRHWPLAAQAKLALFFHGIIPAATAALGYLPARAGLGEDLPANVAREWARWCTSRGYLVDHVDGAAARFDRFDRPTLLMSFADDDFAPPRTVAALRARLRNAPVAERAWKPGDADLAAVGHFGFFRPKARALWPGALDFVEAALREDASELPTANQLCLAELQADLDHGRD